MIPMAQFRSASVPWAVLALGAALTPYILLEKKLLPLSWWLPVSKAYFWPLMLPNYLLRVLRYGSDGYFTDVDRDVILGAVPMVIAGHVELLHRDGVRAVVNLQAEYDGPLHAYAAVQPPIEQLRLPVTDHTEPSVEVLQRAVAFIAHHRSMGHRVLVHCKGGHGRSAAVAAAWLIRSKNMTPTGAQQFLSSIRHVRKSLYRQEDILQFTRAIHQY